MFCKKTTKVYRNGKLVNVIQTNMSESKYFKDLAKGIISNDSARVKTKLKLGLSSDINDGKVLGTKSTHYLRKFDGSSDKYVYDTDYKFYSNSKRRKHF